VKPDREVEGLDLLLVDGDNLLHRVRGIRDEGGVAWLLPRLRAWRPEHLRILVALDGHAPTGAATRQRVSPGIEFGHSGSHSADDLIIERLKAQPWAGRDRSAVVTADRGLISRAHRAGALAYPLEWLIGRLGVEAGTTPRSVPPVGIGTGKPQSGPPAPEASMDDHRSGWAPGRGATRKAGNPHRTPKRQRRR
jgi:hypothetical protein